MFVPRMPSSETLTVPVIASFATPSTVLPFTCAAPATVRPLEPPVMVFATSVPLTVPEVVTVSAVTVAFEATLVIAVEMFETVRFVLTSSSVPVPEMSPLCVTAPLLTASLPMTSVSATEKSTTPVSFVSAPFFPMRVTVASPLVEPSIVTVFLPSTAVNLETST